MSVLQHFHIGTAPITTTRRGSTLQVTYDIPLLAHDTIFMLQLYIHVHVQCTCTCVYMCSYTCVCMHVVAQYNINPHWMSCHDYIILQVGMIMYMYTCTCTCVYIVHVRFLVNIHDHIHVHVHVHVYECRNHVSLSLTIPGSCWDCWFPMIAPHLTQSAVTLSGRAGLISGWHIGELTPGTFLLVYNACLCTYIVRVLYTVHFEHMYNPSSIFLPPLSIILPLQHHLFPLSPSFCSSLIPSPSLCPPPPPPLPHSPPHSSPLLHPLQPASPAISSHTQRQLSPFRPRRCV